MTAVTGRSPRCSLAKAMAAAAVSTEMSGSMTMRPSSPSTRVISERSNPRSWWMPSATVKSPASMLSRAWRQRLGLTVGGASCCARNP